MTRGLIDQLPGLAYFSLQVGLQLIGTFVLRDFPEHILQTVQFFFRGSGPAVGSFCFQVSVGEVGRHGAAEVMEQTEQGGCQGSIHQFLDGSQ
jgi:hypothetical protein